MAAQAPAALVRDLIAVTKDPPPVLGQPETSLLKRLQAIAKRPSSAAFGEVLAAGLPAVFADLGKTFPVEAVSALGEFLADSTTVWAFLQAGGADVCLSALWLASQPSSRDNVLGLMLATFFRLVAAFPRIATLDVLRHLVDCCNARHAAGYATNLVDVAVCNITCYIDVRVLRLSAGCLTELKIPHIALRLLRANASGDAFLTGKALAAIEASFVQAVSPNPDLAALHSGGLIRCAISAATRLRSHASVIERSASLLACALRVAKLEDGPGVYESMRKEATAAGAIRLLHGHLPRASSDVAATALMAALYYCIQGSQALVDIAAADGTIKTAVSVVAKFMRSSGEHGAEDAVVPFVMQGTQLIESLIAESTDPEAKSKEFVRAGGLELREVASRLRAVLPASALPAPIACSRPGCTELFKSRCSKCATPYCSSECQRLHWTEHKLTCKARTAGSES